MEEMRLSSGFKLIGRDRIMKALVGILLSAFAVRVANALGVAAEILFG